MGNDFHNNFSRKIFAVLCVVCEGFYQTILLKKKFLNEPLITIDIGSILGQIFMKIIVIYTPVGH